MRKIEEKMLEAWNRHSSMKSGNTRVITKNGITDVLLHNNFIAAKTKVEDRRTGKAFYFVTFGDGNHPSRTTASRLRALTANIPVQVKFSSILNEIIFIETKDGKTTEEWGTYQCNVKCV